MTTDSKFQPCRFFANGHLQTWAGALLPRTPQKTNLEHLHLPDGDILELHWLDAAKADAPILLLLHGLEGSVHSPYIQGMLDLARKNNWRAIAPHLRGSSGRINNLPESYHAGRTDDLETIFQHVYSRFPNARCAAVGYSLGGNLLLKYLGENPSQDFIKAAVGVSVPFDLEATVEKLGDSVGKLYEKLFVQQLKNTISQKIALNMAMPVDEKSLANIKTVYDFDDKITAPLHQFLNAKDYYQKSSCIHFLPHIETPTLIIHAKDDPMIPARSIPTSAQVSPKVILDIQQHGGHVGFISCKTLGTLHHWLEDRILPYLSQYLTNEQHHE